MTKTKAKALDNDDKNNKKKKESICKEVKKKQRSINNNQKITSRCQASYKSQEECLIINQTKDINSMKLYQVFFPHVMKDAYPKNLHFNEHKQPALARNKEGLKIFLLVNMESLNKALGCSYSFTLR